MLLTEEQALTKYCVQCFIKREGFDTCRGSECMAWRWNARPQRYRFAYTGAASSLAEAMPEPLHPAACEPDMEWVVDLDKGWCGWVETEEHANTRRRGYCGLVGKPETES